MVQTLGLTGRCDVGAKRHTHQLALRSFLVLSFALIR